LTAAAVKPPYVLGGWSLGAFFIRLYTKHYPDEVLGLVTLDGTPFGLPPPIPGGDLLDNGAEAYYMAAADVEVAASPSLGARPLIVLTHGVKDPSQGSFEAMWLNEEKRVARLSSSSILVSADLSGHGIAQSQPNLTAEAFREVIAAVRTGRALPACAESQLLRFHATCLDPTAPSGSAARRLASRLPRDCLGAQWGGARARRRPHRAGTPRIGMLAP
jgi:pimeloyl-ACP methyl ester carboxylesterase